MIADNYRVYFLREPDAALAGWVNHLVAGVRDEVVLAHMLGIPNGEFFTRVTR